MFLGLDPLYFVFLAPGMLLALWAQYRVQSAYARASTLPAASGATGRRRPKRSCTAARSAACASSRPRGCCRTITSPGSGCCDSAPTSSPAVRSPRWGSPPHEAGHAIQDARRYPLLVVRNLMVPLANFGGGVSTFLIMLGLLLSSLALVKVGIVAFGTTVVFQLVNLPVEFDASRRARQALLQTGLVSAAEDAEVKRVLDAAALTYVAATLTSVLTLLYFLFRAGLLGGRRD